MYIPAISEEEIVHVQIQYFEHTLLDAGVFKATLNLTISKNVSSKYHTVPI